MAEFITADGQTFDTLSKAQTHVLAKKHNIDGFHLCFVQEVRPIPDGGWEHFSDFATPQEHTTKFQEAAEDAIFCVYNPGTGENVYCYGKEATSALVATIVEEYAVATNVTKIFQHTGAVNTNDESVFWPYVEVQA